MAKHAGQLPGGAVFAARHFAFVVGRQPDFLEEVNAMLIRSFTDSLPETVHCVNSPGDESRTPTAPNLRVVARDVNQSDIRVAVHGTSSTSKASRTRLNSPATRELPTADPVRRFRSVIDVRDGLDQERVDCNLHEGGAGYRDSRGGSDEAAAHLISGRPEVQVGRRRLGSLTCFGATSSLASIY
jgi:hypothetical protein